MRRTFRELDEILVLLLKLKTTLQRPFAHFESRRICGNCSWEAVASMPSFCRAVGPDKKRFLPEAEGCTVTG